MKVLVASLTLLAAAAQVTPAAAQILRPPIVAPVVTGRTPLGCAVDTADARLLRVTNTTRAPITAETRLYIDAVHFGTNEHEEFFVFSRALAPGQVQEIPLWRATGCTAWLVTPAAMAP